MLLLSSTIKTPVGPLTYLYDKDKLVYAVFFDTQAESIENYLTKHFNAFEIKKVSKGFYDKNFLLYLKDASHSLATIPVRIIGTERQIKIWNAVAKVKVGQIARYKDIAERTGNIKAVRNVGTTIGLNPVCLIIPCHRVLASDGSLGGYSGGLDKKEWLLQHEGILK